jgi:coenzyme F420-0:L-glutamate ligase/coenzyme F420-1:gamma-L-glutamate ligase
MPATISIIPVHGIPEVRQGDDVGLLIAEAVRQTGISLLSGDVVVVTQKIVSKGEGRFIDPATVQPSPLAVAFAEQTGRSPADVEIALREARRVVRMAPNALILETRHGFVCANAGVDHSNVEGGLALLLPEDPDASAARIRERLAAETEVYVPVIISDTFGRPWRMGQTNVAIGIAGMSAFNDYRGQLDSQGREMRVTQLAVADELASAAELVQNKVDQVPVAIIRGYGYVPGDGKATELVRPAEKDLFR